MHIESESQVPYLQCQVQRERDWRRLALICLSNCFALPALEILTWRVAAMELKAMGW